MKRKEEDGSKEELVILLYRSPETFSVGSVRFKHKASQRVSD